MRYLNPNFYQTHFIISVSHYNRRSLNLSINNFNGSFWSHIKLEQGDDRSVFPPAKNLIISICYDKIIKDVTVIK